MLRSFCHSSRLVQDRELQLTDGTRLMEERRYQAAMKAAGLTTQQMEKRYHIVLVYLIRMMTLCTCEYK